MRIRERHLFFSSKDDRTVILTRQDFLPDCTADGDSFFTLSNNILSFRRSLSSYFLARGTKTSRNFVACSAVWRSRKLVLQLFCCVSEVNFLGGILGLIFAGYMPLPHYSSTLWPVIDPIFTFGQV